MKRQNIFIFLVMLIPTAFHFLFWEEKMGLNVLLFTVLAIGSLFFIYPKKDFSKPTWVTMATTTLLAITIILNNSLLSKIMYMTSFTTMLGFVHQKELNFFIYGIFQSFINLVGVPISNFKNIDSTNHVFGNLKSSWRFAQLSVIPLVILFVFYGLYYLANPNFAALSDSAFGNIDYFFSWNISIESVLFGLFGVLIAGSILWKTNSDFLVRKNLSFKNFIFRKKIKKEGPVRRKKILALKNEFSSAVMLMGMLNILLFIVNLTDIRYVWFNFEGQSAAELSNFVHAGTWLLIAAILLAMTVILFYFRGNLNFFSKNKILKQLTYVWIGQNAVLAISVFMRNYHYIDHYGLAYKRIGVMIFLLAVMHGLVSIYKKVEERRSTYFLMNSNAWGIFIMMTIASFINWDTVITKHNITTATDRGVDIQFLVYEVSDKNIYLLYDLEYQILQNTPGYQEQNLRTYINSKARKFERKNKDYSFLSWNYSDARNRKAIEQR